MGLGSYEVYLFCTQPILESTMTVYLIPEITDYILLNVYSFAFSDLYNGKTGVSLALFKPPLFMKDDYLGGISS